MVEVKSSAPELSEHHLLLSRYLYPAELYLGGDFHRFQTFKELAVCPEMMDGLRSVSREQKGGGGREKVLRERWVWNHLKGGGGCEHDSARTAGLTRVEFIEDAGGKMTSMSSSFMDVFSSGGHAVCGSIFRPEHYSTH